MNKDIKKRIIFYFYAFENYKENRAIKIHLQCLKYYSYIFSEALFIIAVDDVKNTELISSAMKDIMDCGFENITFKVHKNNGYCETQPFYHEIVENMEKQDGLTFLGHTKGITNYSKGPQESIDNWIIGLYYLSLNNIDEVEFNLTFKTQRFYGGFLYLLNNEKHPNKDFNTSKGIAYYSGTFYWINCLTILNDINNNSISKPLMYHQRGYFENFPAELYCNINNNNNFTNIYGSYRSMALYPHISNLYKNSIIVLEFLLGDGYILYKDFAEKLLSNI